MRYFLLTGVVTLQEKQRIVYMHLGHLRPSCHIMLCA